MQRCTTPPLARICPPTCAVHQDPWLLSWRASTQFSRRPSSSPNHNLNSCLSSCVMASSTRLPLQIICATLFLIPSPVGDQCCCLSFRRLTFIASQLNQASQIP